MFIVIGKLLKPFFTPLGACYILCATGALVYWRWSHVWGRRAIAAGMLILIFFSNLDVGEALVASLEDDFEILTLDEYPTAGAIVVLGGSTLPAIPPRTTVEVGGTIDRLLHGIRLLQAGRAPLLVLSGGYTVFVNAETTEANQLQLLALEFGADPEAILLEEESRNTYENGLYTRALLQKRGIDRILLVTSAKHMPRAVGVFRTQGFEVIPAPTDVDVVPTDFHVARLMPDLVGLEASTDAIREYSSIAVYRLKGWIR